MEIVLIVLAVLAVIIILKGVRIVPQQSAYVIERLGKFHSVLHAGISYIVPSNTLILPANFGDISSLIATAMSVVKQSK